MDVKKMIETLIDEIQKDGKIIVIAEGDHCGHADENQRVSSLLIFAPGKEEMHRQHNHKVAIQCQAVGQAEILQYDGITAKAVAENVVLTGTAHAYQQQDTVVVFPVAHAAIVIKGVGYRFYITAVQI